MDTQSLCRIVFPTTEAARTVRHAVRRFLAPSMPRAALADFLVAFNEVMINAVRHGGDRPVRVHVQVTATEVRAVVQNSGGDGLDPDVVGRGTADSDAESGRGLQLAACHVDTLHLFSDAGTLVCMTKGLGAQRGRAGSLAVEPARPRWLGAHVSEQDPREDRPAS